MSPHPYRPNQGPRAHPCFVPVSPTQRRLQCHVACEIVAAFLGISAQDMLSRHRARADIAHARHTAIYLAHVAFQLPPLLVAEGFGRDRSSVAYALQRIEDQRDDPDFDRLLTRMENLAKACRRLTVPNEDGEGI
ncbi:MULTISPECIES: helix-turn-helix domain-containing protein [unclassified Aureimonas]|uniref:helix-turn-helix domain-containing protein n=1 Tax=unclassified Aureimonas TaxID=2615206 RepID=UPI000721F617|nr:MULTISPECIES: helix-turn-helix domain-containing protein [unclassified Aureimonas]ALN73989.1 hypothetical protein M673_14775 [Aureimonas sp. AU20]